MAKRLCVRPPVREDDLEEELIPGIPNDITLHEITPRLPWRAIRKLYSTSTEWAKAIEGHIVHNARVRQLNSEKTFAVITRRVTADARGDCVDKRTEIWLYSIKFSMRNELCFRLPPIPGVGRGYPEGCECVSLDSKIYVMGGKCTKYRHQGYGRRTVYMLDLAGAMQWEECAKMAEPRQDFGTAVMNGKIFVFGGWSNGKLICRAEVYDPEVDSWAPIKPMVSKFHDFLQVATNGEEFFVHGSTFIDYEGRDIDNPVWIGSLEYVKIYNPAKDEWRLLESFGRGLEEGSPDLGPELFGRNLKGEGPLFDVQGVLHQVTPNGILVHDQETHWWTLAQVHEMPFHFKYPYPRTVICSENELFIVKGQSLFCSKGLGDKTRHIQWQVTPWPRGKASPSWSEIFTLQCSIKLAVGKI